MKNKSWIIILIMGIALAISIGYSIKVSSENAKQEEKTVTTSITEMTATTVTIKNTLKGIGTIQYKEEQSTYQITLLIEDKDIEKAKIGQEVEISIKREEETLNYIGKVINIDKDTNNKWALDIEIINIDKKIEKGMQANCTVIIEKAENVVGLPIEAIQKNDKNEEFVDVVQEDRTTVPVSIKTGISDDYYVEITYGLEVGDRVQIVKSTTTIIDKKENTNKN